MTARTFFPSAFDKIMRDHSSRFRSSRSSSKTESSSHAPFMEEYRKDYKEKYADSEEEYLDKIPDDLRLEIISKATETAMKSEIEGYKCPSPSPTDDNAKKLERYKDVVDNIVKHCTIANQSNTGRTKLIKSCVTKEKVKLQNKCNEGEVQKMSIAIIVNDVTCKTFVFDVPFYPDILDVELHHPEGGFWDIPDSVIEFKVDISENGQPISSCRFSSTEIDIFYEGMTGGFTAFIDVVKDEEDEGIQNIQQFLDGLEDGSPVVNFDTTEQRQLFQTMFFMPGDRQAYEEFIRHLVENYKYDKVKISFRDIQYLYDTTMKLKALREQN